MSETPPTTTAATASAEPSATTTAATSEAQPPRPNDENAPTSSNDNVTSAPPKPVSRSPSSHSLSSTTGHGEGLGERKSSTSIGKTTLAHLQSLVASSTAASSSAAPAASLPPIDIRDATAKAASDYAQYLKFENLADIALVAANVDEMLARLDEMRSLSETIHRESIATVQLFLPHLIRKTAKMQDLFLYIEQVEKYITHIKGFVAKLEDRVELAEKEYQSKSLKKMFDGFKLPSLFSKKSLDIPPSAPPVKFQPIEVFRTEDFFPPKDETAVAVSAEEGS